MFWNWRSELLSLHLILPHARPAGHVAGAHAGRVQGQLAVPDDLLVGGPGVGWEKAWSGKVKQAPGGIIWD